MRILINGVSAKTGGGRNILHNFLTLLSQSTDNNKYIALVPDSQEFKRYENGLLRIVSLSFLPSSSFFVPAINAFILPRLVKKFKIDAILNFADLPIPVDVKQVFVFDWAYAVYPRDRVWDIMNFKDKLMRKAKKLFFLMNLRYVNVMVVQTEVIKRRITEIYNFKRVEVIPNAISLPSIVETNNDMFDLPSGVKFLYLTHYYSHKNLEIFLPLAQAIKEKSLNYKLIITIAPSQDLQAKKFLDDVSRLNLNDVIINLGPVEMGRIAGLYRQCDGALIPSLLESFSATFIESLFYSKPIFASDLDFARAICGDAAIYFDPFSVSSILGAIEKISDTKFIENKIFRGKLLVEDFIGWNEVFCQFRSLLFDDSMH